MVQKELTKAEEQVMQYMWEMESGFLKDIVEQFPDPKPAYTTVSTVVRVLVNKGFMGYTLRGKTHEYRARISKDNYFQSRLKPIISNYFSGSASNFASYFANEQLNLSDLEAIKIFIDQRIKKIKTNKK